MSFIKWTQFHLQELSCIKLTVISYKNYSRFVSTLFCPVKCNEQAVANVTGLVSFSLWSILNCLSGKHRNHHWRSFSTALLIPVMWSFLYWNFLLRCLEIFFVIFKHVKDHRFFQNLIVNICNMKKFCI